MLEAKDLKISYKKNDDEILWSGLKSGDREALNEIYYRHVASLISYGHQFTRKKDVVDDCIQEVFITLWQKRDRISDTKSVRPYLLKCLKRSILRNLKKSEKSKAFSELSDVFPENNVHISGEADLSLRISQEQLQDAFIGLSPLQRELIYLKYYNNLSCDQMKDMLDLTKKQVYNALSKAMISLRNKLAKG